MSVGTLLIQIQRSIEAYFTDEKFLLEEDSSEFQRSGFLPIKTIITYKRMAELLLPIQSVEQKVEVVRRSLERQPRSKVVQLTVDRNQICKRMQMKKKDSSLYNSRSVYYEGISGSPQDIAQYLQKHFQSPPIHILVEGEGYGFLVFANEQQAVELVNSVTLRSSSPLKKKLKVMMKKDFLAQQALYSELLKDMTAQYEMQNLFPLKEEPHQCHLSNSFARVIGFSSRTTPMNLKHAVMHYEDPVDIQQADSEAIIRFRNRNEAKLFLGKCPALNLYGQKLQVEEIKMDEAFELLEKQHKKYPHSAPTSLRCSRSVSRLAQRIPSRQVTPKRPRAQSEDEK